MGEGAGIYNLVSEAWHATIARAELGAILTLDDRPLVLPAKVGQVSRFSGLMDAQKSTIGRIRLV
jgi:hypothetical protein